MKTFAIQSLFEGADYVTIFDASTCEPIKIIDRSAQAQSYDLMKEHHYTLERTLIQKYRTEEQAQNAKKWFKKWYRKQPFMIIIKESAEPFIEDIETKEAQEQNSNQLELF